MAGSAAFEGSWYCCYFCRCCCVYVMANAEVYGSVACMWFTLIMKLLICAAIGCLYVC